MIPNPYILLAIVVAFLAVGAGGYATGWKHKANSMAAQEQREEKLLAKVASQTAEAIADIEIKNTTIRQKVETVTREVPVYRDCQHTPDVLGLLNSALEGGSISTGEGELSKTDPTR